MEVNFCGKCGSRLYQGSNFCPSCGDQVGEPFVCPGCKKELHPDTELCPSCGLVIEQPEDTPETKIEQQKTLIEIEETKETEQNFSFDNQNVSPSVISETEIVEQKPLYTDAPEQDNSKIFKMVKIESSIKVSKTIILILGIFTLIQAFLLMIVFGVILSGNSFRGNSRSFFNQNYTQQNNHSRIQSVKKQNPIKKTAGLSKKSARQLIKLFIVLFILSIIQGAGFLYLARLIKKKPFIAILIAFIFKITFDIVRVAIQIIQSISGIVVGYGNISDKLPSTLIIIVTIFQVLLLGLISGVLCYYLWKGLKSSIELRKIQS